jgi:hypothetical protein
MSKVTKSTRDALMRLVTLMPEFVVEPADERGRVMFGTTDDPWGLGLVSKRYADALGLMADIARAREDADEIRFAVRWGGKSPTGLPSHYEVAFEWLANWEEV